MRFSNNNQFNCECLANSFMIIFHVDMSFLYSAGEGERQMHKACLQNMCRYDQCVIFASTIGFGHTRTDRTMSALAARGKLYTISNKNSKCICAEIISELMS